MEKQLVEYQSVIADVKNIISSGQKEAYYAANKAMVTDLLEHRETHSGTGAVRERKS